MKDQNTQIPQQEFAIHRIYVKDVSLETPGSPQAFLEEWQPVVTMDLQTEVKKMDEKNYEIILTVTVTTKVKEKVAFLIEVKQAGIFSLAGFNGEQLDGMQKAFCPNILYPYLRETVTDLVVKAGFPPLYLQPINFDALYLQQKEKEGGSIITH